MHTLSPDELSKEYLILFHGIGSITNELQSIMIRLGALQQQAEQAYIERTCNAPVEDAGQARQTVLATR